MVVMEDGIMLQWWEKQHLLKCFFLCLAALATFSAKGLFLLIRHKNTFQCKPVFVHV